MARLVCVCTWAGRWWASSCTSTACWMLLCRNRWQLRWYFLKIMCWLNTLETSCGSQVIIPMDDDVTVLNRPVETKYYSPPPDHVHAEACPVFQLYSMYNTCCILFIVSQPERQHPDYLYFRDTTKAMISSSLSSYLSQKTGVFSHQCCQSIAELRSILTARHWYSKCGFFRIIFHSLTKYLCNNHENLVSTKATELSIKALWTFHTESNNWKWSSNLYQVKFLQISAVLCLNMISCKFCNRSKWGMKRSLTLILYFMIHTSCVRYLSCWESCYWIQHMASIKGCPARQEER